MNIKANIIAVVVAVALIGGSYALIQAGKAVNDSQVVGSAENVTIVDGVQIVEIQARGGYWPRKSVAQAGIPTVIRFNTSGTFDCSSSVRIPSLDISKVLPQSGATDIEIGAQATSTLQGTCGMGMYPFEVSFR